MGSIKSEPASVWLAVPATLASVLRLRRQTISNTRSVRARVAMMPTGPGYKVDLRLRHQQQSPIGDQRVALVACRPLRSGWLPALQIAAQVTQTAIHQPMTLLMLLRLAPNLRQRSHQTGANISSAAGSVAPACSMSVVLLTTLCGRAAGGIWLLCSTRSRPPSRSGCVATIRRRPPSLGVG